MNSKRILFLLVAVIVAGGTAMMARAWLQAERAAIAAQLGGGGGKPVAAEAPKPTLQVLVVKNALRVGHILKPDDLRWQAWPQGNLPAAYIVEGKRPITDFVGAVVRLPVYAGQPLVENDIVMPGSRGFLAAVLRQGMRAVSLPLTATSGVSGFIYAGDRVDVLLTHAIGGADGKEQHNATETILRNARVIAIDQKADFVPGDKPEVAKNATLELTPKQAEIITLGNKMGELSLALRSLQDEEGEGGSGEDATAELGFSSTQDNQVSRLLKDPNAAPEKAPDAAPKATLFVLRGSQRLRQDLDGSPFAELNNPAAPDVDVLKPNATPKAPTNPSSTK